MHKHYRVHGHRPGPLLHTEALWYSLLLPGYNLGQHVTVQNNTRLNEMQEKMRLYMT